MTILERAVLRGFQGWLCPSCASPKRSKSEVGQLGQVGRFPEKTPQLKQVPAENHRTRGDKPSRSPLPNGPPVPCLNIAPHVSQLGSQTAGIAPNLPSAFPSAYEYCVF